MCYYYAPHSTVGGGQSKTESNGDLLFMAYLRMGVILFGYERSWKCLVERAVDLRDRVILSVGGSVALLFFSQLDFLDYWS